MSNTQIPELNEAMREMGQNIASEIDRLQTENEALKAQRDKLVFGAEKILGMLMTQYHSAIAADCAEDDEKEQP